VKANKGAPGIDGMTVEAFASAPLRPCQSVVSSSGNQGGEGRYIDRRIPAFAREHWPRIAEAIRNGTYRPAPVRRVWIILPSGRSAESLRAGGFCASHMAVASPTGRSVRWGFRRCWIA